MENEKMEDKILEILKNEILSVSQLAKRLNVKRYILIGYLEALREQGKIDVFQVGRAKVYVAKERLKKGLFLFFFLTFLPLLFFSAKAEVSVEISAPNIWIITVDNQISYIPNELIVNTNCQITYAVMNNSNEQIFLAIQGNQAKIKTSLLSPTTYNLTVACNNETNTIEINVNSLNLSSSIPEKIYQDTNIVLQFSLYENGNTVSNLDSLDIYIDGNKLTSLQYKYSVSDGKWIVPIGYLSVGKHNINTSLIYKGVQITFSREINVYKNVKIESLSTNYIYPNSSLTIYAKFFENGVQIIPDLNYLSVYIGNNNALITSIDQNSITILTPSLQPGTYSLRVNYKNYYDDKTVYYVATIRGILLDENNKPIYTNFYFYKNSSEVARFSTDSSGNYKLSLPIDTYDLKIEFPQATLFLKDFIFENKDGLISYNYKDSLPIEGLKVYGFYFFEFSGTYSSVELHLKYKKQNVESEDKINVYVCEDWNFASNSCNSKWQEENFEIDKVNSKVILKLNHLSAFVLGRKSSLKVSCSPNKNSFFLNESLLVQCLVEDEDGNSINNAKVILDFDKKSYTSLTNNNGISTFSFDLDKVGNFKIFAYAEKDPYLKGNTSFEISVEKRKEIFILFPETIRLERGKNTTIDFSIVNTGQAELSDITIYLQNLQIPYSFEKEYYQKILPGEKINNSITFFVPENYSLSTYPVKIYVSSKELEKSKDFAITIIESSKPIAATGFSVKLPSIKISKEYVYLTIFAIFSFSFAYLLKKFKRRKKRNFEDIFGLIK
ncbi:MAG: IPT/TIG domain-containing protein [Candidatus Aenigmatarchaeota archaeon]